MELRVYGKYFFYLYTLEDFTELTIDRCNLGVSQLRLSVDRRSPSACFLQRGNWLQKAGVHEFYSIQRLEVDNELVTATAYSPHFFTQKYLIKPEGFSPGAVFFQEERKVTGSYDKAAKDWFNASGINMTTAPVRSSGESVTLSADCWGALSDALEEILAPRLMGVRYRFSEATGGFVFDTAEPVDRTMGNEAGNAPAVFSVRYDNLLELTYSESDADTVNTVYTLQKSAADKTGSTTGSVATLYGGENTGYDRREASVSLSDGDVAQQLVDDAVKKTEISFTAQVYEDENLVYGADYDIGDIVTAWLELPSLQYTEDSRGNGYYDPVMTWRKVDQQITGITEHYTGAEKTIDVTFGTPEKTLPEQLKEMKKKQAATGGKLRRVVAQS